MIKSYDLPAFCGPGTLVFAVSFSGDTAETLEAAERAAAAGASVVVVTSAGPSGSWPGERAGRWPPSRAGSPSPAPPSGPWPSPPWLRSSGWGCSGDD